MLRFSTSSASSLRGSPLRAAVLARRTSGACACREPAAPHAVDREEIFVGLSGRALAEIGGEEHELGAGDTLIVPPNVTFSIRVLGAQDFEAMVIAPVGVHAILPSGERFAPPWTE